MDTVGQPNKGGKQGRLARMARVVIDYATPFRVLTMVVLVGSLFVAIVMEVLVLRGAALAVAGLAVFTLLAQLDRRLDRVATSQMIFQAAAPLAPPRSSRRRPYRSPPLVTVSIPGKNEASYARDCIQSLQAQTLENFEAVIIDDDSTDSTLDVVLDAIGDDSRFRVIRTDRSVGIGLARNHGVRASQAKYVTFLDLDDFLAPDSLASRVESVEERADMPWVAGSYCWHEAVDAETTPSTWMPRTSGESRTVSWTGHYDDNFFIASAPLLRRDAFLAVGGFDDAPTTEDAVLWFRLLRWGFVLAGTGSIGIAYRQKATSHAVATAVGMRDTIAGLLAARSEAQLPPTHQDGPFFFADDLGRYRTAVGFTRRTAAALGIAVAAGSQAGVIERLVDDLRGVPSPLIGWEVDVRELAARASRRVTRPRGARAREGPVARELGRLLTPLIESARDEASRWMHRQEPAPLPTGGAVVRPVRRPRLLPVTPRSLPSLVRAGRPILLLPAAAYHTDELIELVEVLRDRGFAPVAALDNKRWATTGAALARVDVEAVEALPAGDWLLEFEALLTFNDWGEYYGEYVTHVTGKPTVSFAKVEGVQDWEDHDTGRTRRPYLASDVVLCQGENDVRALQGRRGALDIVGSSRLEAIWNKALPADNAPRVVGNVNFTYGVQTEHRDLWVETLRDACRRAGVPLDLSLHPAEAARYPDLAASEPIRHLMVEDSILVSRFSTVLFEGMARGCSVIYYNPHGEQVPTFHEPDGAFDIAENPEMLADFIGAAMERSRMAAKKRAEAFFLDQVSIAADASAAERTVRVIERHLTG